MSGEEWFSTDKNKGISSVFKNSFVKSFVDAEEYYADLRSEIESTGDGYTIICWAGFEGNADTPMPALSTGTKSSTKSFPLRASGSDVKWFDLLKAASDNRGVNIRVLLNLHPAPDENPAKFKKYKTANLDLVTKLNTLKNCAAINDFRYLFLNGVHHQKLVLVYNKRGLMAYCGTCDIESGRITEKWCEVHCKIMGDAAGELYNVFHQRWREHLEVLSRIGTLNRYIKPLSELKVVAPVSGNFLVQTATTYGNPNRVNPFVPIIVNMPVPIFQEVNFPHRLKPLLGNDFFLEKEPGASTLISEAKRQNKTYSFAPNGHTGIYHLIKKAIENTKQFIYVEDQYLVCDRSMGTYKSMLDLLIEKLKQNSFKKLIILCTRMDDINNDFQRTGWLHRYKFIRALKDAGKKKVDICQYKSRGQLGIKFGQPLQGAFYVHSKTWIFDDLYLITGSANCNRRGYSHDSELNIGVYDQNKTFVKELRIRLWKNRLNTEGIKKSPLQDKELCNFLDASIYWQYPEEFGLILENEWSKSFEPKQYPDLTMQAYEDMIKAKGYTPKITSYINKIRMDGLWDYVVDPDGT